MKEYCRQGEKMNRKELVEAIVSNKALSHITKKDADQFIGVMTEIIKDKIRAGEKVSLVGFGTFTKFKRAARNFVNPKTGDTIHAKEKTFPKFRPGKAWKEMF